MDIAPMSSRNACMHYLRAPQNCELPFVRMLAFAFLFLLVIIINCTKKDTERQHSIHIGYIIYICESFPPILAFS